MPTKAIATAREAMQDDPEQSSFDLVEVLIALDRLEDAHQELERLRSKEPAAEIDRRLALLAYEAGDLKEAQQRFAELASSGEAQRGRVAVPGRYRRARWRYRCGDRRISPACTIRRSRCRRAHGPPRCCLRASDRKEALTLLDDYVTEHPDTEVDLTVAKAHLLADHGEADAAVELLNAALERHPRHPSIEYERAVILEQAGRVHDSRRRARSSC